MACGRAVRSDSGHCSALGFADREKRTRGPGLGSGLSHRRKSSDVAGGGCALAPLAAHAVALEVLDFVFASTWQAVDQVFGRKAALVAPAPYRALVNAPAFGLLLAT